MDKKLSENLKNLKENYGLVIDNNTLYSGHTNTKTGSCDATNPL